MNQVLWVEDSPDHWLLMEIAATGTRLADAYDIAATFGDAVSVALERHAQGQPYRVVATDLQLPGGNGWEVVAALREQGYADTTFLVLSASNDPRDVTRSLDLGCEHVTKPLGLAGWIEMAERLADEAGLGEDLVSS